MRSYVSKLRDQGVEFKNEILEAQGRKQIIRVDPADNVIELFEAHRLKLFSR